VSGYLLQRQIEALNKRLLHAEYMLSLLADVNDFHQLELDRTDCEAASTWEELEHCGRDPHTGEVAT